VAARIAQTPGFGAITKTRYVTLQGAVQDLASVTRFRLQQHCQADLPPVAAAVSLASLAPGAAQPQPGGRVVVVSSDMTGDPGLGFAGYLQESLGLPVEQVHVPGGNAFDAITGYMTSRSFAQERPAYLVWENPVWQGLGDFGDQPLAELTAAAGASCRVALPVAPAAGGKRLQADLGLLEPGRRYVLALDSDSLSVASVWFNTPAGGDAMRSRSVHRAAQAPRTGRFFMPLTADGVLPARVEIESDAPFGPQPRLSACLMEDAR
jgi:alginate biosynthesis protein AlgX